MKSSRPYILLIDDDEDDLHMFSSEMERKGIKVNAFESPASALTYLTSVSRRKKLPALIIIDYNLPGKNGEQVLVLVKSDPDTQDIPVVIYSNNISDELKERLLKAGALQCLQKAWSNKEFNTHVQGFHDMFVSFTTNTTLGEAIGELGLTQKESGTEKHTYSNARRASYESSSLKVLEELN